MLTKELVKEAHMPKNVYEPKSRIHDRKRERETETETERETERRLGEGLNELNLFLSEQKKRFSRSITALNSVESVTSLLKSIYLYFWYNGFALCCSVQFSSHSFDI